MLLVKKEAEEFLKFVFSYFKYRISNDIKSSLWFPGFESEEEELKIGLKTEQKTNVRSLPCIFNQIMAYLKINLN